MSTLQSKCDLVAPLLGVLADGEATPAEAAFAETHLSACASCASELAFLRATNRALSRTPDVYPSAALSARIAQATYARPSALGRLQAFLRPAPVRVAAGSLVLASLAAVAFIAPNQGGDVASGPAEVAANDNTARPIVEPSTPSVAANNNVAPVARSGVAKPTAPGGVSAAKADPATTVAGVTAPRQASAPPNARPSVTAPAPSLSAPAADRRERVTGALAADVAVAPRNNRLPSPRRVGAGSLVASATPAGDLPSVRPRVTPPVSPIAKPAVRRETPLLAGGAAVSPVQPVATTAPRESVRRGSRKPLSSMPGKIEQPPTLAITFAPRPAQPAEAPDPAPETPREPVIVASAAPAPETVAPTASSRRGGLQLPSLRNQPGTTEILTSSRSRRGGDVASAGRGDNYEFGVTQGARVGVVQSPGSL